MAASESHSGSSRETQLFEASYEFQTKDDIKEGVASGGKLLFKSISSKAMPDFFRWWRARHAAFEDYFTKLCAVKIYSIVPQEIDVDGGLPPANGMFCQEWKCDFPNVQPHLMKVED